MKAVLADVAERIKNNPAVVLTFLAALFGLLASFGFELTKEQTGAITAFVTVLVGFVVRSQVTPTRKVAAKEDPDSPEGDLTAGPASELPDDSPVDVVPAENVYGVPAEDKGLDDPNL